MANKKTKYDYNQVVIGAGSAGLITSYISALVKAKVALIEKHQMGGDCLNTGCVPSKALIKSAKVAKTVKESAAFGVQSSEVQVDFAKVMEKVQEAIKTIEPHDSVERYSKLGVECHTGEATILSPHEVSVNGKTLTTKHITIATGASPFVPEIEGLEKINFVTSDSIWKLRELPKKFLVIGGGAIGCELAQSFSRLGSQVTLIERGPRILSREGPEASKVVSASLKQDGVEVLTETSLEKFLSEKQVQTNKGTLDFDLCLFAIGRRANTKGFGLENLKGIEYNRNGSLKVDPYLRLTKYKNIYACGDVAGPYQLTHAASHQAWYVAVNSLFGPFYRKKTDYSVLPRVTYTDPEVASVGKTETELKAENTDYMTTMYELEELDRAICDSETKGFVKVFTKGKSDKILGACITASHGGDMLLEFTLAMRHGLGLNKIMSTIHPYPTFGEANKALAGQWKNKTKPEKAMKFLAKLHRWRRS